MVWDPETNGTKEQWWAAHEARRAKEPPPDPRDVRRMVIAATLVCLPPTFTAAEFIREFGEMNGAPWEGGIAAVEELIALDVIRRTDAGLVMGDADMSGVS